ncbi:DUF6600 domain-containing protein [Variovorax sp. KK3]|uniref:DUF6600 domain-containing protein n=1 Tax=Variovorax sp. KK3 TaxID=1855728 RepID=UPI00097BEFC2|nr:DUF6600 domain-containing protein [Variovorax sp. KK3]
MTRRRATPLPMPRAAGCLLGLLMMLLAGSAAWAQEDPPGRVARLNEQQGTVSFSPAGDDSWYDALPNRPITTGDRLWTDRNARAELQVDASALRMDDRTQLLVSELDDDNARFTLTQGRVQLSTRDLPPGQRLEIGTANMAVVVESPGDLRIEADPASDTTRVAVASGGVTLFGENGQSVALGAHQQLTVSGRQLAAVSGGPVRAGGDAAFERWVAERESLAAQSVAARYVPREVLGYQQLDRHGEWQNDPSYGAVWYPRSVDPDWAPYRDGQWADIAPWGWTWIDAAPWGFATSHYGRWARVGPRWGWVPGRMGQRPVYAPALVGFVGGGGAGANLTVGNGRPGVGWFPLAPGEAWRPGYRASQRYVDEANRAMAYQRQLERTDYLHRNTPGALSLVPVDIFGRGPINRRDVQRVPDGRISQMQIANVAPVPLYGGRQGGGFGRSAAAMPPPDLRPRQIQEMQARQLQQAQQFQQLQQGQQAQQQLQFQQRAVQAQQQQQQQQLQLQQAQRMQQAQQAQQAQQMQQMQQLQQRDAQRQQQDLQQRAAQAQYQQQLQLQQLQQQQQSVRAQQEMQQRAAQAAQAQQLQMQQAQQAQQMQQIQQQQAQRAQQAQQQQMQQMQQMQQNNALRQSQEIQQRTMQQMQQRAADARAQQLQRIQRDPGQGDRP